jgi:hypothetical protein
VSIIQKDGGKELPHYVVLHPGSKKKVMTQRVARFPNLSGQVKHVIINPVGGESKPTD